MTARHCPSPTSFAGSQLTSSAEEPVTGWLFLMADSKLHISPLCSVLPLSQPSKPMREKREKILEPPDPMQSRGQSPFKGLRPGRGSACSNSCPCAWEKQVWTHLACPSVSTRAEQACSEQYHEMLRAPPLGFSLLCSMNW